MAYWLMKSEPDVFSFDDMQAKTKRGETEAWHGVRNYAARNNMRAMALGDQAFFYHSNIGKEIVGIIEIVGLAHPDDTADLNAKGEVVWECVDVAAVKPLPKPVTLATVKATPELSNLELVKLSRLSVSKVSPDEWALICTMGGL
jgi:predicted RNA-binding protein with PUA-like domain